MPAQLRVIAGVFTTRENYIIRGYYYIHVTGVYVGLYVIYDWPICLILYTVQYTLYNVHCTLYSERWTVSNIYTWK